GHKKTIAVRIGEQPSSFGHPEKQKKARGNDSTLENMGLSLQDLSADLAKQFNYSKGQGVLIAEVAPDSPASRVGLRPGQLIEEVNQIRIHSLSELKKALKNADNPKQILLRIRAGEFSQYVVLHSK
ncbi:MAG: serine protease, partial [Desulfobulbus sp.]